jgi:hypothetical protein
MRARALAKKNTPRNLSNLSLSTPRKKNSHQVSIV